MALPAAGMPAASASAEHRPAAHQAAEPAREAGGDAGARPHADGEADGAVEADAVDQHAGERRAGCVGDRESARGSSPYSAFERWNSARSSGASVASDWRSR